jgi:4-carboxymuconolactone decarboxylase
MDIKRSGSQPSTKGQAEYFTGTVRIDPLFQANSPARALGSSVSFEPRARTAWHTHPLGQTLIVTAGRGLVQRWGGPIEEIRPGDVVWTPPGEKHWHGATATTPMTHIAILEQLDGKTADWMGKVTDEQYGNLPPASQATPMPNEPTAARNPYTDIAPALGNYTDSVLYGDLWKRPGLSTRDRSLITVATLVALYRTNELPFHLKRALENGVTKDELIELITHLAFYSGWPTANTAVAIARKVFEEAMR